MAAISIIIPTYNEEEHVGALVHHLWQFSQNQVAEIIVTDGGSQDNTLAAAEKAGARAVLSPRKGRAAQMNYGTTLATGNIYYFVHADSWPPATYVQDILEAIAAGYQLGCYRFKFRSDKLMLRLNSYCTRFDRIMCRGGDQSLFVLKTVFEELGSYKDNYVIMEEYDFIIRARKKYSFKIIPKDVLVSARKYDNNSYLRVNLANLTVFLMFYAGCSQLLMLNTYKRLINHPKL
ncbi:TIGR04283 family arsenosugar biosynthesis glycosyltransferase [Adhaeribacter aquaticus]|uniref:TIGR04283 family arsenosugar biosynthesis glycosyltransferase n=1 Tax=Adhaeribacter aquaticus TaxID=299567 RepID=UPI0003F63550|nr:TIGR04283 family arsenosugar biosynthesis glycosyltransferase [Adhaeribacter aquaticus]